MSEKDLGKALITFDFVPSLFSPDMQQLTRRILERDRRRIRFIAVLATLLWILTTAGIVCIGPFYVAMLAPRLRAYEVGKAQLERDWNAWAMVGDWAVLWLLTCMSLLLLAAVCTVLLILVSRRATLRQINANLMGLSGPLKHVRQALPSEPSGATEIG